VSSDLTAEAAFWIVKLNGLHKSQQLEAAFGEWLRKTPAHALAFQQAQETWEQSTRILRDHHVARPKRSTRTLPAYFAAAASLLVVVGFASTSYFWHRTVEVTDIGEYSRVPLEDGSTLKLNTATRVDVNFKGSKRLVDLTDGEAAFDVFKLPERPFLVDAGDALVRAHGTLFSVRRESEVIVITLFNGSLGVFLKSPSVSADSFDLDEAKEIPLNPGDRMTIVNGKQPVVDRPKHMERSLAWEQGQIWFDGRPLSEVIAEFNRYTKKKLTIADPQIARLPISGSFTLGSSLEFAEALSRNEKLTFRDERDQIVLIGRPAKPL